MVIKARESTKNLAVHCSRQVTDLTTRTQCFNTFVEVIAGKHLEAVLELMAYTISNIQRSQNYARVARIR